MAVRQDDTRSWAASGTVPGPTDPVAVLADLSAHRPRQRPDRQAPTSSPVAAPAPGPTAAPAAAPGPAAGAGPVTEAPDRRTPARPTPRASSPDLAERPTRPGFSADGGWWWDGERWTSTEALERNGSTDVRRGRRRSPALVWTGVVAGLLVLLGLAAAPVLWSGGAGGSDEMLQTALLEVAEAQQQHLMDHGRFASDDGALGLYVVRLGGIPEDVTVEVLAGDELTYCVTGSAPDGARLWVSESGTVTSTACA